MANWIKAKDSDQLKVYILGFKAENYYAEFEIIVESTQCIKWKTYKRYSEFKKLYDGLVKTDNKFKIYFPPKKSFNSMSSTFLDNRRICLEKYLNEIISLCSDIFPRKLMYFLEMEKYEVHGITNTLAKTFSDYGRTLLKNNNVFEISVLYIHSINERMLSPLPTNLYNKADEDFGNVLEVVNSLKKVLIIPNSVVLGTSDTGYGTSSIKISNLIFDISIFSSVTDLQINSVEISNLRGLYKMNTTVERLRVHHCLKSLEDLLFADFPYRESSIDLLQKFDGPLRCATDVNLSHNSITGIDKSIVTLRQVQQLNLSFNHISDIQYMYQLIFLTDLDLSYNNLYICQTESLSTKLGSIKRLSLKGNKLSSLTIVDRMFSLEYLDISDNRLSNPLSLLSLCRLSCIESILVNDNPLCSHRDFPLIVFDLFLDRFDQVKVNGYLYQDMVTPNGTGIAQYRAAVKSSIVTGNQTMTMSIDSSWEQHRDNYDPSNQLSSVDIRLDQWDASGEVTDDWILNIADVYNVFHYWFFVGHGKCLYPKRLLWVTETFAPNRNIRPMPVLLVTSGTHTPNMIKCRLVSKVIDSTWTKRIMTVHPINFVVLSYDFQRIIVGSDKGFLRVDEAINNRDLYLCNTGSSLDTFICQLYHLGDNIAGVGDSRIVHLNEEDRMEMMRRFVDCWRIDMDVSGVRNCANHQMHNDADIEFIFISRAMTKMKNGFQILLTVVVTREIMYLVDERIYDWPAFNSQPNLSDNSSGTCGSLYTLSGGQFPFLRTNAYFLCQIDVCDELPISVDSGNIIDTLCPMFRYPVKITFKSGHQNSKDPLTLLFISEQRSSQLCRVMHQRCDVDPPQVVTDIIKSQCASDVSPSVTTESPSHLRHLSSSYIDIRLSLSTTRPQLSNVASSSPEYILALLYRLVSDLNEESMVGVVWSKFLHLHWDVYTTDTKESPGLVCLSQDCVCVLYEVDENDIEGDNHDYNSDPEDDRDCAGDCGVTKLKIVLLRVTDLVKVFVGLNCQWLSLCFRGAGDGDLETDRLVILVRNKTLCKHIIEWLETITAASPVLVEYGHEGSDVVDLLMVVQPVGPWIEADLVHYCSVEDVRFGTSAPGRGIHSGCKDLFSIAAVLTEENLAIVQYNICEYPIREVAPGSMQHLPSHAKYQVLLVVPLVDCVQLQLPGHDRSVVIIVIRTTDMTAINHKIQLTVTCQKEQKRLIDKLRKQRSKCLHTDVLMPVNVC